MQETTRPETKMKATWRSIRIYTCHGLRQKRHANSDGRMPILRTFFKPCTLRTQIYVAVQTQYTGVAILTWQADVLNLQVLEGGRTGVAKETVRRHDATFRLALAPRQTWRNVAHVPRKTETATTALTYLSRPRSRFSLSYRERDSDVIFHTISMPTVFPPWCGASSDKSLLLWHHFLNIR